MGFNWTAQLQKALERRYGLEPRLRDETQIGRYFAGRADGLDGVIVDAFGALVVLTIYNPAIVADAEQFLKGTQNLFGAGRFVIGKIRSSGGGFLYLDPCGVLGKKWIAQEDDCLFETRADDKNDFGLFPDARAARLALRTLVSPESVVLNLFSYTCGFAVVAQKQGAKASINVDANPEMLTWGKRNADLNGVDFSVVPELAQKYLARLERRVEEGKLVCPDIWVCDPPAFGVGRGPQRVLKHFWDAFWGSVERLSPRALVILRNDRTGYREGHTLARELTSLLGGSYELRGCSFADCPSLCYEEPDAFYKLNESLVLLRR